VREIARRLGISKYAVRQLIAGGKLPAFRHGANTSPVLVWESDLNDYLKGLTK